MVFYPFLPLFRGPLPPIYFASELACAPKEGGKWTDVVVSRVGMPRVENFRASSSALWQNIIFSVGSQPRPIVENGAFSGKMLRIY